MNRREFLKTGGVLAAGGAAAYGLPLLTSAGRALAGGAEPKREGTLWGMVIDLRQCSTDCHACVDACREENNVAFHDDENLDIYWIRKVTLRRKFPAVSPDIAVPLLCNHCDHPPCAQACPVAATYRRDDGVVIVDHHRCIGCRYCMIACPYNARHFNYKENEHWPNKDNTRASHGVPESCNFCSPRIRKGLRPKCLEACRSVGKRAIFFGDLNDPESDVARLIARVPVKGIREDLGTKPKVLYIGL
jgi:molybdopterin-containing oxidoreductase family iron-sulfur binding subunit